MKKIRVALFFLAMALGIFIPGKIAQADTSDFGEGPNVGDYVYEDKEYITNEQYDRIAAINRKIDTGVRPQHLYMIVSDSDDVIGDYSPRDEYDSQGHNSLNLPDSNVTEDFWDDTFKESDGSDDYFDDDDDDGMTSAEIVDAETDLAKKDNYLICDLKNNRIYFQPSTRAGAYITDLFIWKSTLVGVYPKLKMGSTEDKVDAALKVADRMTPRMQNVAESDTELTAMDFDDVDRFGYKVITVLVSLIVLISIFYFWGTNKDNGGYGGGSADENNEDYDAGFDEGYYYGSHDPFM